jgi:hypothetical protein
MQPSTANATLRVEAKKRTPAVQRTAVGAATAAQWWWIYPGVAIGQRTGAATVTTANLAVAAVAAASAVQQAKAAMAARLVVAAVAGQRARTVARLVFFS